METRQDFKTIQVDVGTLVSIQDETILKQQSVIPDPNHGFSTVGGNGYGA